MSAPSEPEKYSIDEMMERLKKRPAEDPIQNGELVTRADGSQAIRVRKRKRRSHQPHKEERQHNRRARMIQVSGALILMLLALFAAGAGIIFANSAPFREALIRKISNSCGAAVELRQFRMNPTTANAGGLTLRWPDGNALRDLTLRNIRAEIFPASFLGKSLTGEEITAPEGALTLRIPQADQPKWETPSAAEHSSIHFKRYVIPKLQVLLGEPTAPVIRLMNTEGALNPTGAGGRPQLLLTRGDLTINGWPGMKMDRSHIEFRGTEVDVVSMRLRYGDDRRGALELSGNISPFAPERSSTLTVGLDSYQLAGIAGPELGRLFAGRIDTLPSAKSNYLTISPASGQDSVMVVEFRNSVTSAFELSGFPFLSGLAQTLDEKWFSRPVFENDVHGSIRRSDGTVTIENLSIENKNRLALRGTIRSAKDHKLSGTLEVGVPEGILKASKNRGLDAMFGPSEEGFRWVPLKISGTAAAPSDNFQELYEASLSQRKTAPAGATPSFEELTQPR